MMSRTLPLSDRRAARVIEAGRGEVLLLIHGVGLRAEAWGPQIKGLAPRVRVVAVDLPGHGQTDPLPDAARLPAFVAWAARVVDALGTGPVNLAGHSMGALIACGLAVDRPDLVRRVALLNGVHRRNPAARAAVLARADDIAAGRGSIEAPLARWFAPEDTAPRDLVAGWLSQVSPQGYATAYRAFAEGDALYADRLAEVRVPLLVLTGDGDANSTPEMTRAMAAMAAQGRAVVIAGHRHMVNLTAAPAVTQAMQDWLEVLEIPA